MLLGGSVAEIASQNWRDWLGAAVLVRLGVGLAQTILITYVSELAPFRIRGFMIGWYQVLLITGQLIVATAAQLKQVHQPTQWRPLIATEFLFIGVLFSFEILSLLTPSQVPCISIWFFPGSHIYLARKNQHEQAKKSLLQLYGYAPGYDVVSREL